MHNDVKQELSTNFIEYAVTVNKFEKYLTINFMMAP